MSCVKKMLRGLLIGVAGIVPGVSGGTLAVSMGVYGQIIGAVSHLFQRPGESVRILLPYGLGMAAGIGGLAFVIETLFGTFPFAASMAFLGLILGGIPSLLRKAEFSRSGLKKYVLAVAVFCLILGTISGLTSTKAAAGLSKNLREEMFSRIQDFSFTNIDIHIINSSHAGFINFCYIFKFNHSITLLDIL